MLQHNKEEQAIEDELVIWTQLSPPERRKAMQWLNGVPDMKRADILSCMLTEILPELRAREPKKEHARHMLYAALLMAIRQSGFDMTRKRGYRVAGHKEFASFERLRQGTLQSLRNKRKSPVRKEVLAYWGEVKSLKTTQQTGFGLIARYLQRVHKVRISASYLAALWKEIEG